MSLTVGFCVEGCIVCEMVGNGRRARDGMKEGFRLGTIRCAAVRLLCDESANGDETRGRDIVIVAKRDKQKLLVGDQREVRATNVPMVRRR
jgi:hypothetical protein